MALVHRCRIDSSRIFEMILILIACDHPSLIIDFAESEQSLPSAHCVFTTTMTELRATLISMIIQLDEFISKLKALIRFDRIRMIRLI